MGASKSKGLDWIATVGYGYIYTREMNLGLLNNLAFPSFDYWRLRRRLKCEKFTDDTRTDGWTDVKRWHKLT